MARASYTMRVGFDARWHNDSGVGTYVAELLRAMAGAPRDFELVVYEDPLRPVPGLDEPGVIKVPVRSGRYSLSQHWEFRRRVRQDRLDLFHCPFYGTPWLLNCPLVITVHDLIPFLFPIYSSPKQQLVKSGYRVATRLARHIFVNSKTTARDVATLLNVGSSRITVTPLAARESFHPQNKPGDLERLVAKYEIRPPYLVLPSARNWPTKNLESAVQAVQLATQKSGIKFQTVIFGPREGVEALSPTALKGLNLRVTGYLELNDLAAVFRNAHVFITAPVYEGFGLPVIEAMACGCAVVCSNTGSLAEVAGMGAQTFTPFDIAGMSGAIARLLDNPEELGFWKEAALRSALNFSWKQTAALTIDVYNRVLKEGAARAPSTAREEART